MVKNIILTSADGKQNLKGILTLENIKNGTLINVKIYNYQTTTNKLVLGIKTGGELYKVELDNSENYLIEKSIDLNDKISAVVLEVNNNETSVLIWGSNETTRVWKTSMLDSLQEKQKNRIEQKLAEIQKDNSIIEVNKFNNKLDYETDEEIETIVNNAFEEEPLNFDDEDDKDNKKDFLSSIENQINELLNNYEEEKALEDLIPNSKFVKVSNNGDNFYIFGVIYENNEIRYIVYGLPGEYSVRPDDEYTNFYQWLPLNSDNPEGYGYYLMYQDALTGDQIEVMYN